MRKNIRKTLYKCISVLLAFAMCPYLFCTALEDTPQRYNSVHGGQISDGAQTPDGINVSVAADKYSAHTGVAPAKGDRGNSILWTEDTESLSWTVDVPTEGLYNIKVSCLPAKGSALSPSRKLLINGVQPFEETSKIVFDRLWVDETEPVRNALGDDVCPMQKEVSVWREVAVSDSQGRSYKPLEFLLKAGKNTIDMEFIGEPLMIDKITVCSVEDVDTYEEALAKYTAPNATKDLYIEAEDKNFVEYKTESSILSQTNSDPSVSPFEATNVRLNVIGAYSWVNGHQEICWNLKVPETGIYKIHLRALQNWNSGLSSYRSLRINGKLPFEEAGCLTFKYNTKWQEYVVADEEGEPYLFELQEGDNKLTLSVEFGPAAEIAGRLTDASSLLTNLIFDITRITGFTPDPNYDYKLEDEVPNLISRMTEIEDIIVESRDKVKALSTKNSTMEGNFKSALTDLETLKSRPTLISTKLDDLNTLLTNLSDWAATLQTGPLALDFIELLPPDAEIEDRNVSGFKKFLVTMENFFASFTKDYNAVGGDNADEKPLDIWVSRGKEWAQIIEERSADFTKETGRAIKFHVLPSGSISSSVNPLLLTLSSGVVPDVVLGLPYDLPVEYALRNMVCDLTEFSDFKEVKSRFLDQSLVPFTFQNHVYALPETISFRVMYYRTDIFKNLGLKVPNTWDEMYNDVLPVLNQNNMKLYVPQLLDMFLYQNDGDYYTKDGKSSALTTGAAYNAFKELCELYTDNGVPVAANFYNRFRTGEIPIGLENASQYLLLAYAAPEIAGNWEIAPIPGHVGADGKINRTNSGTAVDGCIILEESANKEDAWKFLSWWTRADTQSTFARQVEGRIGAKARWLSANQEAFKELPWSKSDRVAIESAWKWVKETPVVLGSYFTNRHLVNAINRTVVQGMSARDSLEEAVEQINVELSRRQAGYYRRLERTQKKEASAK